MKKPEFNIKAVWLWSAAATIFTTLSGWLFGFNFETTWAYVGIGVVCLGLTAYSLLRK